MELTHLSLSHVHLFHLLSRWAFLLLLQKTQQPNDRHFSEMANERIWMKENEIIVNWIMYHRRNYIVGDAFIRWRWWLTDVLHYSGAIVRMCTFNFVKSPFNEKITIRFVFNILLNEIISRLIRSIIIEMFMLIFILFECSTWDQHRNRSDSCDLSELFLNGNVMWDERNNIF